MNLGELRAVLRLDARDWITSTQRAAAASANASAETAKLSKTVKAHKRALVSLMADQNASKAAVDQATVAFMKSSVAYKAAATEKRKLNAALTNGVNAQIKSSSSTTKAINKTNVMRAAVLGLAAAFAYNLVRGVGQATRALVRNFAQTEKLMVRVGTIAGANEAQFMRLNDTMKDLAGNTRFTSKEISGAMEFMAMAGLKTNDIIGQLPATLKLASASNTDLTKTADIMTNIATAFQRTDAENVASALTNVTLNANVNLMQLGEGMKSLGSTAKSFGVSMEESAAAIGILRNAGMNASMAGRGLRQMLIKIEKASPMARAALGELGLQAGDSAKGIEFITRTLQKAEKEIKANDFKRLIMEAFDTFGGPTALSLVNQGGDAFATLAEKALEGADAMNKLKEAMDGTIEGKIKLLDSAVEGLGQTIGRSQSGPFADFLEFLTDLVKGLDDTATSLDELGTKRSGLAALAHIADMTGPGQALKLMTGDGFLDRFLKSQDEAVQAQRDQKQRTQALGTKLVPTDTANLAREHARNSGLSPLVAMAPDESLHKAAKAKSVVPELMHLQALEARKQLLEITHRDMTDPAGKKVVIEQIVLTKKEIDAAMAAYVQALQAEILKDLPVKKRSVPGKGKGKGDDKAKKAAEAAAKAAKIAKEAEEARVKKLEEETALQLKLALLNADLHDEIIKQQEEQATAIEKAAKEIADEKNRRQKAGGDAFRHLLDGNLGSAAQSGATALGASTATVAGVGAAVAGLTAALAAAAAVAAMYTSVLTGALEHVAAATDIGLKGPLDHVKGPLLALAAGAALLVAGLAAVTAQILWAAVMMTAGPVVALSGFVTAILLVVAAIPLMIAGFVGLGAAVLMAAQQSTQFKERVAPVVELLNQKFYDMFNTIAGALEPSLGVLALVVTKLSAVMQPAIAGVANIIAVGLFSAVHQMVSLVLQAAIGLAHLNSAFHSVVWAFASVGEYLTNLMPGGGGPLGELFENMKNTAQDNRDDANSITRGLQGLYTELGGIRTVTDAMIHFEAALAETTKTTEDQNAAAKQINLPEIVNLARLRRDASDAAYGRDMHGGASFDQYGLGEGSNASAEFLAGGHNTTIINIIQVDGRQVYESSENIQAFENYRNNNGNARSRPLMPPRGNGL